MKQEQRKEIEAKWQRLLAGSEKSRKPAPSDTSTVVSRGTRVVRRRRSTQP